MTTRQIWIELQDGTPDAESINHVRRENRGSLVEGGKARYAVHMQSLNSVVCFEVLPVDHGIRWNNSRAKPCSGLREKFILPVALLAKQRRVESKWNFWVEGDGLDVLRNLAVRTHMFVRSAHGKCGPLGHPEDCSLRCSFAVTHYGSISPNSAPKWRKHAKSAFRRSAVSLAARRSAGRPPRASRDAPSRWTTIHTPVKVPGTRKCTTRSPIKEFAG